MGVSVRHNSRLAALVALAAAVMTVAWFSRALQTSAWTDWLWCLLVAAVALLQLFVVRDGRAPLMVADELGVRVRRGETWSGLRWQDIEHVDVQAPKSWLRDGRVVVHPRTLTAEESLLRQSLTEEPAADVDGTEATATPRNDLAQAYVLPLARTTKVDFDGLSGDLAADLDSLASGRVPVLVLTRIEPEAPAEEEVADAESVPERAGSARARFATLRARVQSAAANRNATSRSVDAETVAADPTDAQTADPETTTPEPAAAEVADPAAGAPYTPADEHQDEEDDREQEEFTPVAPAREPRPAARVEVVLDSVRMLPDPPAIPSQRSAQSPVVVAKVDDYTAAAAPRPAENAVIGPIIAAARHRTRLSIDGLSERTRIRPHVLECIEIDDFEACGGDFYARGHLRTLARIFGLDPQQLLDLYDEHYARPEIEAKQVFEAELATGIGGGVRSTYTGPRWSLLVASVLALASIWGMARVFNDTPQELVSPAPNVVDAAGLATSETEKAPKMTLATLEVTAKGKSPQVVIRDRDGRILWAGKLADGQRQQVIGLAPFDVTASVGEAVKVSFLGKPKGAVGDSQAAASKEFG